MDHNALLEQVKPKLLAHLAGDRNFKVDTSTWSTKDVQTLNYLLDERTQAITTHYTALPKPGKRGVAQPDFKPPNDWKYDINTAGYFFAGTELCALDRTGQKCHHPICQRAKTKDGISLLEYDTITHYAQRILTAKTPRMKDALRKQRDFQLIKDKSEEQEFKDKAMKKINQLGRKAGNALLEAVAKYDKYWIPPSPPEPPENAVELVGKAISHNRLKQIPAYGAVFLELISATVYGPDNKQDWRDCTRVVDYFRKVYITHLEAAMMNIRDAMDIIGVLTYEMDYCLRAFLEQFHAIVKHIPRKIRNGRGMCVYDALHYAIQIMDPPNVERTSFLDCDGHLYRMLLGCGLMHHSVSSAQPVNGRPPTEAILQAIAKTPNPRLTESLMQKLGQKDAEDQPVIIADAAECHDVRSLNLPVWVGDTTKYIHFTEEIGEAICIGPTNSILDYDESIIKRYFHPRGEGLVNFLHAARFEWQFCLPSTMISLTCVLTDLFEANPFAAKNVLRQLAALVSGREPGVPHDWSTGFRTIGEAMLFSYGFFVLEGTRCFGRYDVDLFAISATWILLVRTIIGPADKKLKRFETALHRILKCIYLRNEYIQPYALREFYKKIVHLGIRCDTPSQCYGQSSMTQQDNDSPSPITLDLLIQQHTGRENANARLWRYTGDFLQACHCSDFDKSMASRVLKFVSLWVRPDQHEELDRASLDLLWHLFLRAESLLGLTPGKTATSLPKPTSLNVGMHNQASFWDLDHNKVFTFFAAFEDNFRTVSEDMAGEHGVFASFNELIRDAGSSRPVKGLLNFLLEAERIPEEIREYLKVQYNPDAVYENCVYADARQTVVNELDYLSDLANVGCIDRPNADLMLQFLRWKPGQNVYFPRLADLLENLDMKEAAEDVIIQSAKLIAEADKGNTILADDPRLLGLVRIAEKAWDATEHVDIVYELTSTDAKPDAKIASSVDPIVPENTSTQMEEVEPLASNPEMGKEQILQIAGRKLVRRKADTGDQSSDNSDSSESLSSDSSHEQEIAKPTSKRNIPELDVNSIDVSDDYDSGLEINTTKLRLLPKLVALIESLHTLSAGLDEHYWAVDHLMPDCKTREAAKEEYTSILHSSGLWLHDRIDDMNTYFPPGDSSDEEEI